MFRRILHFLATANPLYREKPSIGMLAHVVTIAPNADQIALRNRAEPALTSIVANIVELNNEAMEIGLDIDNELRSIIGKAYAARKRLAREIYVKTPLEFAS